MNAKNTLKNSKTNEVTVNLRWTDTALMSFNREYNTPFGETYAEGNENQIISKNIFLSPDDKKTRISNHILAIGGPASGKTRCVVLPNLMRAYGSYIVMDPYGDLYKESYQKLKEDGYNIKVLDLINPSTSEHYNPLLYIKDETDVRKLVNCLLENTIIDDNPNDLFWIKSEETLLCAIILYLINYVPKKELTFSTVLKYTSLLGKNEKEFEGMIENKLEKDSKNIVNYYYNKYKTAPEKTRHTIADIAVKRLNKFIGQENSDLTVDDSIALDTIGDTKTAIFLTGFHLAKYQTTLVPMLCMQAFDLLIAHAADDCEIHHLPYHVTLILDEFALLGVIPELVHSLSVSKSYGVSAILIAQTIGQIEEIYKDDAETILSLCGSIIFLGNGNLISDSDSKTYIAQRVATEFSKDFSVSDPGSLIDDKNCLVFMWDMPPFLDKKYQM